VLELKAPNGARNISYKAILNINYVIMLVQGRSWVTMEAKIYQLIIGIQGPKQTFIA